MAGHREEAEEGAPPTCQPAVPVMGYGFAWVGHFFVEKNRPATFTDPLYSLAGDWVMYYEFLTGRLKGRLEELEPGDRFV